jgi:hypothetical protein
MTELIVGVVAGLLVGWWFVPQPQWVKNLYDKWFRNKPAQGGE